jgi:hypothetical protein
MFNLNQNKTTYNNTYTSNTIKTILKNRTVQYVLGGLALFTIALNMINQGEPEGLDETKYVYETYIMTGDSNSDHIFKKIAYGLSNPNLQESLKCNSDGKEEPDTCGYIVHRRENSIKFKQYGHFYKDIVVIHNPDTKSTKLDIYCHFHLNTEIYSHYLSDRQTM